MSLNRREFVQITAGAAVVGIFGEIAMGATQQSPSVESRPVVIASGNGLGAVARASEVLRAGGDPVDAVVAGVTLVEDDPSDHSVGLGGLPNEDGVVELDACVMHGPTHRSGAVGALRGIRNPSQVAALVARRTDHCLLVGEGALKFARAHGFKEEELLTDESRRIWLKWKETHSNRDAWLHPEADVEARARLQSMQEGPEFTWGTISCIALSTAGDLGGCTTTSGLSYKLSGRVGDSPIIGAGLYVDNEVGGAGSTGRGEANIQNLSTFLVVELMRGGHTPEEACLEAMKRVATRTEKRLRNAAGEPSYGLSLYAVRKDGTFGGAVMRGTGKMAVCVGQDVKTVELPGLYTA